MGLALAVVAGIAVVAALLLGGVLYFTWSSKAKVENQLRQAEAERVRADLDRQKAVDQANLALARNHQDEVLANARNATNLIGRLQAEANRLTSEADALKTSKDGRLVALDADLVAQARNFFDVQLRKVPPPLEVTTKLESARRIEQQILKSLGTTYEPEADLKATVQTAAFWAEQNAAKVSETQTLFDVLLRDAKVKNPAGTIPPDSLTLEAAMAKLKQDEAATKQQGYVRLTDDAKKKKDAILAETEATRIVEEAKIAAEKILSDARKADEDFQRQQALVKAQGLAAATTNQLAVDKVKLDAQKAVLRQKASDPQIKAKLAPFITPGLWQIKGLTTTDFKPLSYTQLQTAGALDSSSLHKFVAIARNHYDKVRPRWNFSSLNIDRCKPEEVKSAKEAQDLLIELGPVLVDMGLLQP